MKMKMKTTTPATQTLDDSTRLLKAFADPVRLRLVNLLSEDREICVCHLHEALGLPQPTVSRHLAYLRKNGVVVGRKEGLWVHYRLAKPKMKMSLHRTLIGDVKTCLADLEVFRRDREQLARVVTCCAGE
jgi:ArsR family transcriptional regulator, arsenate/arsenite/antimonite-responsive transcriptional repressor